MLRGILLAQEAITGDQNMNGHTIQPLLKKKKKDTAPNLFIFMSTTQFSFHNPLLISHGFLCIAHFTIFKFLNVKIYHLLVIWDQIVIYLHTFMRYSLIFQDMERVTVISPHKLFVGTHSPFSRYSSRPLRRASSCCSDREKGHFPGSLGNV